MTKENWERQLFYLLTPALMGDPFTVEWMEKSASGGEWPENFDAIWSESSGREVRLFTGGDACRQSQGLFDLTAPLTFESELDPNVPDWGFLYQGFSHFLWPAVPPVAVPSEDISLGELGNLGSGGSLVTKQPNGIQKVITPKGPGRYFGPVPAVKKWQLLTQTVCATPTNRARTTLGVGEEVDVYLYSPYYNLPANWSTNVSWTTTAGSLSGLTGGSTRLTAPSNAAPATVTMHYKTVDLAIDFDVVEPSGSAYAQVMDTDCWNPLPAAMAGMFLHVVMAPTNVSLYRVQIMEVPGGPTKVQGWFSIYGAPQHDAQHLAGQWYQLGCDNAWPGNDHASSDVYNQPWSGSGWSGGSFTWHIPVKWKIDGGQEHLLDGWDQDFTLLGDGTVTITKFGHTVTRHANQNCGTAQ